MTTTIAHPGPRDAIDEGSVEELAEDSREMHLDVAERRPWGDYPDHEPDVPDDASRIIEGFEEYGS